jgi:hypothetical protein
MNSTDLHIKVNPDTTVLVRKLKAISACFDALAEELEGIDAEANEEQEP